MIILITKKNSIKIKKLEKDIENKFNILLPYITTTKKLFISNLH